MGGRVEGRTKRSWGNETEEGSVGREREEGRDYLGEGERKIVIYFTEHKNQYDNEIISPTYISFHLMCLAN